MVNILMDNSQAQIITTIKANSLELPLDVSKELEQYSKIFVSKEIDFFRMVHCCENLLSDYKVFGELPNGDKVLLFTARQHFECDCCDCDDCAINCFFCSYMCCDQIIFQMDYKRNNKNFFT